MLATARTAEAIQDLADAGIETLLLDVTSIKSVAICKDEVSQRTGGQLDYLVNNAGKSTRTAKSMCTQTDTIQTTRCQPSKPKNPKSNPSSIPTSSP